MVGRRISGWVVINRFLAISVGSHRHAWSLGPARQAAFDDVWSELVSGLIAVRTRVVTDSNMNTSCVYEVGTVGEVLFVSRVLPFVTVGGGRASGYMDSCPEWAESLVELGFSYLGSAAARTLSPYRDDESDRRITYFELLFEWIEGSDGPTGHDLVDPWSPRDRE